MIKRVQQAILGSIREIIFGLEDGLVSTLGVITGIAEGTQDRFVILLSGIVVIFVESLSMAAGTYLSNKSEQEARFVGRARFALQELLHRTDAQKRPIRDSVYMGVSYVIGGTIPVLPYLVFPIQQAILVSVLATIVMLFAIGVGKGKLTHTDPVKSGIEMAVVSLSAAALGFLIGKAAAVFFPQIRN